MREREHREIALIVDGWGTPLGERREQRGKSLRSEQKREQQPEGREPEERRRAAHQAGRPCDRMAATVSRPRGAPLASTTVALSLPRQSSSESTSRSEAEVGTVSPSALPSVGSKGSA